MRHVILYSRVRNSRAATQVFTLTSTALCFYWVHVVSKLLQAAVPFLPALDMKVRRVLFLRGPLLDQRQGHKTSSNAEPVDSIYGLYPQMFIVTLYTVLCSC